MRSSAACPRPWSRQARMTWAPARPSSSATWNPSPLFAPVTIARRPAWEGMSAAVQSIGCDAIACHGSSATSQAIHALLLAAPTSLSAMDKHVRVGAAATVAFLLLLAFSLAQRPAAASPSSATPTPTPQVEPDFDHHPHRDGGFGRGDGG